MCTLWAVQSQHGLWCGFNRDESLLRGRAQPPSLRSVPDARTGQPVAVIAPTDSDAGGTWLAASHSGMVVAMLNNYTAPSQQAEDPVRSRGLLPLDLLAHATPLQAVQWLQSQTALLRHTRPFEAALLAPKHSLQRLVWDGRDLVVQERVLPAVLASSGWRVPEVRAAREAAFPQVIQALQAATNVQQASAVLQQAAADHTPGSAERATCLHGFVARTVSHTQVLVSDAAVAMRHVDGWPCTEPAGSWLSVPCSLSRPPARMET